MAVGAKPDVVGQVPAVVIGIRVNDDIVGVPKPVTAGIVVIWSDAEEEATEPKVVPRSTRKPKDVVAADFSWETPVFKWMIQMIVRVVPASVMTNPLIIVRVDVRGRGMSSLVFITTTLIALLSVSRVAGASGGSRRSYRRGAVSGNMSLANSGFLRGVRRGPGLLLPSLLLFVGMLLCKRRCRAKQPDCGYSDKFFHVSLQECLSICAFCGLRFGASWSKHESPRAGQRQRITNWAAFGECAR